jgi:hypothetical protein
MSTVIDRREPTLAAQRNGFTIGLPALKERPMDQDPNEWKAFIRKANRLFRATIHPAAAELPIEGELPSLGGATEWLNSQPLTAVGLHGNVVLIDFSTYTCINWLRSLPYVRAWAEKYKQHGYGHFRPLSRC